VPQRPDDHSILDHVLLWRRVHPTQIELDPHTGKPDVSSGALSTREEVSISLATETTLELFLKDNPEHSVIEFTAGAARRLGCTVVRDPLPHDPAHALVCGSKSRGQLNKTQQELLNKEARVVVVGKVGGRQPSIE
jgi:hypothetical protein